MKRYSKYIEEIKEMSIVDLKVYHNEDSRQVRNAISHLRENGIVFIPMSNKVYIRSDNCDHLQIASFYQKEMNRRISHYKRCLQPIENLITQEMLDEIYQEGLL